MEANQRYLNGQYFETNPTFHIEDSPWKLEQIATMLDRHHFAPKSVCDVGCGAGEILRLLQLRYPTIVQLDGYEISPQGFELAQQQQNETLRFFNSDLLQAQNVHYDLALCIDVVEHIEDCFTFLRGLHRYATHFVFHFPLEMNVQMVLRAEPINRVRAKVGHIHYFSKDTALATLRDTGYQVLDWFYTPNAIDRPKNMKARIAKVPRQVAARLSPDYAARILGGYSLLVFAQ